MDATAARRISKLEVHNLRRNAQADTARALEAIAELRPLIGARAEQKLIADFVPIRLVTILEVFIRDWIATIVDAGSPFEERAERLVKTVKFDYFLSGALHRQSVTLGDIAADAISVSSLASIVAAAEVLLDEKLWPLIGAATNNDGDLLVLDLDEMKRIISRLFEVRHVVVHEWPDEPPYSAEELGKFIEYAEAFGRSLDVVFDKAMWWNDEETRADMLVRSREELAVAEKTLATAVDQYIAARPSEAQLLAQANEAWKSYAIQDALWKGYTPSDPGLAELLKNVHLEGHIEDRRRDIETELKRPARGS